MRTGNKRRGDHVDEKSATFCWKIIEMQSEIATIMSTNNIKAKRDIATECGKYCEIVSERRERKTRFFVNLRCSVARRLQREIITAFKVAMQDTRDKRAFDVCN